VRRMVAVPMAMLCAMFVITLFHYAGSVHWLVMTSWDRLTVQALCIMIPVVLAGLTARGKDWTVMRESAEAAKPGCEASRFHYNSRPSLFRKHG